MFLPRPARIRPSTPVYVWSDDDADSVVSTAGTDAIPSLTRGSSVASSGASAITDMASNVVGEGYLLEHQDGLLTVPTRYQEDADLLCPFQILDCTKVFAEIVPFKMHVFSHFKGQELPKSACCFLCDNKYHQGKEDDASFAWNTMLSHMVHDHYRRGQQLATVRTDFSLMRWMYNRRLISNHHFKRTQMMPLPTLLPRSLNSPNEGYDVVNLPPAPMAPPAVPPASLQAELRASVGLSSEAYTVHAGRRSDRRRRDGTGTGRPPLRARPYA